MQTDQTQKKFGTVFGTIAWFCILFLLVMFFQSQLDRQHNPNDEVEYRVDGDVPTVTLKRNRFGHYVASGYINGQAVTFMLDTGATNVAIPVAIADKLGLSRGAAYQVHTANGTTTAYATRLNSVELGAIKLTDINASITVGYQSDDILLGMSALKQLEFTQRGDTLTLKQY